MPLNRRANMSKICRKCESEFPVIVKIDGKYRNLNSRKFCLDCSPFGSRNTKPDDPDRETIRSNARPYSEWADSAKEKNKARQYYYRHTRMKKAIELKGGKCEECGYEKSVRSLTFHHISPKDKVFTLDSRNILSKKWTDILKELDKCKLLCMNCHMELHEKESTSKYANLIKEMYNYDV